MSQRWLGFQPAGVSTIVKNVPFAELAFEVALKPSRVRPRTARRRLSAGQTPEKSQKVS